MTAPTRSILTIAVLWLAGLLAGGQFAKIAVLLPELAVLYPARAASVAWLLTLVSLVGAVLGAAAGALAGRIGPRPVLIGSLLGGGALSLWQAGLPGFGAMALSRVAEGVMHLGIVVTAPALMAQLADDRWRGPVMALWSTFFGVAFALFGALGIPAAAAYGVPSVLQAHGALALVVGAVLWLLLPRRAAPSATARPGGSARPPKAQMADMAVLWPGIGWLFYTLTFLALLSVLPDSLPPGMRAGITTALSLVGLGVSLLAVPLLLTRLPATRIVMAGFALAAAVSLAGLVGPLAGTALALFAALGLVQGASFAAVPQLNPTLETRAMGYGAMAQAGNIGNLAGTPILLAVQGAGGDAAVFAATAALYAVAVAVLALARRRHIA